MKQWPYKLIQKLCTLKVFINSFVNFRGKSLFYFQKFVIMDRVSVGMHVDIRRSDGRVHNAVISEVRKESQSVTVEWFENVSLTLYSFQFRWFSFFIH